MQHEITSRAPLLDAAGNLREAGYAKRLLPMTAPPSAPGPRASRSGTTTSSRTTTTLSP